AATRQPSLGIFGRDPEQGKPAMPNPEIQCDGVQQEGRDGAASRVTLIRHVAFFVCRTEPVGGPRPVEGCDASPTLRQRHTAGEIACATWANVEPDPNTTRRFAFLSHPR